MAAIAAASRPPSRCCSLSGPENAVCTGHLLVEREPDQERERVARDQRVRLRVAGEVQRVRSGGGHDPMLDD